MLKKIEFSCGHSERIILYGGEEAIKKQIKEAKKNGICSACFIEKKEKEKKKGCRQVELPYYIYIKKYSKTYATKLGSYNPKKKTIIVYVPRGERLEEENDGER